MQTIITVLCLSLTSTFGQLQCPPPIQWQATFGGPSHNFFRALDLTADGGFVLGGSSSGTGGTKTSPDWGQGDFWIVRVNDNGRQLWDRSFGGDQTDWVSSLQQTADGGFIVGGTSPSDASGNKTSPGFGGNDYWVVRLDASGNKLWERSFGGTGGDVLMSVRQTSDGGYILAGHSYSSADSGNKTSTNWGDDDYWIIRLNGNGNELWQQSYGGTGAESLAVIRQTTDGGFILGGYSYSGQSGNKTSPNFSSSLDPSTDYWIVRVDATGNKLWDHSFGGGSFDILESLEQTSDAGFILGGTSRSGADGNKTAPHIGDFDFWIVRLDTSGNKLWDRSYTGTGRDVLKKVTPTTGGGFILGGYSWTGAGNSAVPNFGREDYWVLRLNAHGDPLWNHFYGGTHYDALFGLEQTPDGGFLLAGESVSGVNGNKTRPNSGSMDFWVVKLFSESPDDCDRDGVPNNRDLCPDTAMGDAVNADGCSIAQLCPCEGPWRNHAEYVRCVQETSAQFERSGLITRDQRRAIIREATHSNCGKHR
jgi:hypothetical protein